MTIFPSLALVILVLAVNLLGDWLRDALNPKLLGMTLDKKSILSVHSLQVEFPTRKGNLVAVNDISFEVNEGEVLGVVGESGGKIHHGFIDHWVD